MTTRYGLLLALLAPAAANAQTATDSSAIRAAALDYVEGWYDGNPERMTRAGHPELVKRTVVSDTTTKRSVLHNMGATALVNGARHGGGEEPRRDRQQEAAPML